MTQPALTRHPGVYRRSDSGTFLFGLRVPKDLSGHFPSAWAVRCSLRTSDLRTANDRAKALHAEWALRFESLRTGRAVPVDLDALRLKLFDAVERTLPFCDRDSAGLSAAEREDRVRLAEMQLADAKDALAEGRVVDWGQEWVDAFVKAPSPAAEAEAMAALVLMYELRLEAFSDLTRTYPLRVERLTARRALLGASRAAPAASPPADRSRSTSAGGRKVADALDAWNTTDRPAKTLGVFTRHAGLFASMAGDPTLSSVDRQVAIRFRDDLQAWAVREGKTARTADNILVSVRALFNVARDRGWLDANPFERLTVDVGGKDSAAREPWTHDELRLLFNDPIWTEHRLPSDRKAGVEAAYWIPLIACYSGARVSEIAQLWKDDLTLTSGAEVIEFRPNAERAQTLKTEGSWRAVPMHSELVRLGLPEYAAGLPAGPLFPKLPTVGKNGAGGQFGQWFGSFKRAKGFESPSKTLHSFRHLVATELRLAGATDSQADAITAHAGEGVGRTVYSATIRRQADRLRAVVELLQFPDLPLPRHSWL